jgi:superfamily I DNA/RNA helicase
VPRISAPRLPAPRISAVHVTSADGCIYNNIIIKPDGAVDFSWVAGKRAAAVVGPPGTGKTSTLLRLASTGSFECCGVSVSLELKPEILYLAFNRSAAEDAEERAGEAPLHAVTIHAAGARALAAHLGARVSEVLINLRRVPGGRICGRYALCNGGAECIGAEESLEVLRRCAAKRYGLKYSQDPFTPAPGNRLFGLLDYALHVAPESGVKQLMEQLSPVCSQAVSDYLSTLKELDRYDFTTALVEAERLGLPYIIQERDAPSKVRTAFVDEAQDLSPLMWRYLRRALVDAREVVFALDFYQTVYDSLHGADMKYGRALLDAIKSYGGVVVYLERSKRVASRVAEVAKKVLPGPDPEYVRWKGRADAEGDVYVVTPIEMAKLARDCLAGGGSVFALAPTNADVLWTAALFLAHGLIPRGLKEMPSAICRRLRAARIIACSRAGLARPGDDAVRPDEVAVKLVQALRQRFQYVLFGQPPDAFVCHYLDKAVKALKCGRGLSLPAAPPVEVPNPPPLFVDTPYTAKGLEADAVFVVDRLSFDVKPSPLALYVALTRSRGNVYLVRSPAKKSWVPPEVYREAKRL